MAIPQDRYYDLAPTAVWLKRLLYLSLAMTAVSAVSTLMELRLLDAAERGAFPSDEALTEAAETSDRWSGIIGIISLIVFIATSVQALTWIYRSAHNARVRATYMEYTPASCVWWYFVPIATLWKPFGAMREIWRQFATQAGRPEDTGRALLGAWWTFWIISGLLNQVSLRLAFRAEDLASLRAADKFALFVVPFDVISTIVFIGVVMGLTALQREADANRGAPAPVPRMAASG